MEKLDWAFDDRTADRSAQYRGFTIRARQDMSPENPWEAWDSEPPTLVYAGRREGFTDYSDGELARPFAAMTDAKVSRHWRAIAKALDLGEAQHDSEARESVRDYGGTLAEARRELFESALEDARHGSGTDYLETLAALWRIAGAVAETWASRGYSQGDWAEGLTVATPEWATKVGAPRSTHSAQCKAAGKLWGYWAWGDVYGFEIEGPDGESLDSCWGYYGDDLAESGLEAAATEAVDSIISAARKARQHKAAELIRARVPLAARPAILDRAEREARA